MRHIQYLVQYTYLAHEFKKYLLNGESKKCVATAALSPAAATATPPPVHSVLGQTQYPRELVRDIQVK